MAGNPFGALAIDEEPDEPETLTSAVEIPGRRRALSLEDCAGSTAELQRGAPHGNATEEDGWETVKFERKNGPGRTVEEMMSASPMYTDLVWGVDDGDFASDRDMAKSGAGSAGKGKHSLNLSLIHI
eukprot:TRINITY_DN61684_c0_g1_i6.p1 TRINITY_DN61684_c0_g1~~TRINITY_DN61684_c0_g1_i6.p1  ORF type:complete len:127 (+),score=23.88 TRINITY_DN61684_c0_g1_i6:203-583(+)